MLNWLLTLMLTDSDFQEDISKMILILQSNALITNIIKSPMLTLS